MRRTTSWRPRNDPEVNQDQQAIEIVCKRGRAWLVSEDEYLSLRETVYLLPSPANAERLRESLEQARCGETTEHELAAD